MNKFSKYLVELRKKNNLSQNELAKMLNVSQQTISFWESGRRTPKLRHAILLSDNFNISIEEIIDCFSSRNPA